MLAKGEWTKKTREQRRVIKAQQLTEEGEKVPGAETKEGQTQRFLREVDIHHLSGKSTKMGL